MKRLISKLTWPVLAAGLLILCQGLRAQPMMVKDINKKVVLNPNADRDINMVLAFNQAFIIDSDYAKARDYWVPTGINYGPGADDSATVDQMIQSQQQMSPHQLDKKMDYIALLSVRVLSGAQKGDWVLLWGNYSATDKKGTRVTSPFNSVYKIEDQKIAMEVDFYDLLSVYKKIGFTITPPAQQ